MEQRAPIMRKLSHLGDGDVNHNTWDHPVGGGEIGFLILAIFAYMLFLWSASYWYGMW